MELDRLAREVANLPADPEPVPVPAEVEWEVLLEEVRGGSVNARIAVPDRSIRPGNLVMK